MFGSGICVEIKSCMFAIRERWCLRRKESVDVLVLLDYLKQVKLLSFFLPVMEDVMIQVIFWCVLLGRSEWQRSLLPDFSHSSWAVDSKLAAELCSRWQSRKDKLPCRLFLNLIHTHTETHTPALCAFIFHQRSALA